MAIRSSFCSTCGNVACLCPPPFVNASTPKSLTAADLMEAYNRIKTRDGRDPRLDALYNDEGRDLRQARELMAYVEAAPQLGAELIREQLNYHDVDLRGPYAERVRRDGYEQSVSSLRRTLYRLVNDRRLGARAGRDQSTRRLAVEIWFRPSTVDADGNPTTDTATRTYWHYIDEQLLQYVRDAREALPALVVDVLVLVDHAAWKNRMDPVELVDLVSSDRRWR